jgi:hypothetical protein
VVLTEHNDSAAAEGKGQILMMHVKSEEDVCTRRRMKLAQFPFACHP